MEFLVNFYDIDMKQPKGVYVTYIDNPTINVGDIVYIPYTDCKEYNYYTVLEARYHYFEKNIDVFIKHCNIKYNTSEWESAHSVFEWE